METNRKFISRYFSRRKISEVFCIMINDKELMKTLDVDEKTLNRFKEIQRDTIKEAKLMNEKRKKGRIKVLGISGSARDKFDMAQEESNSETLLIKCLGYCKKLGADTELIKLRNHKIEHCKACYSTTNTQEKKKP